jgi:hypothetical protein
MAYQFNDHCKIASDGNNHMTIDADTITVECGDASYKLPTTIGVAGQLMSLTTDNQLGWTPKGRWVIWEQKTRNSNGGTSSNGSWTKRTLTTSNPTASSVQNMFLDTSSSTIRINPGTYSIMCFVPGYRVGFHKARLSTGTKAVLMGQSAYSTTSSTNSSQTVSVINGIFTVNEQALYIIEHYTATAVTSTGFGIAASGPTPVNPDDVEVYTSLVIEQIA